MGDPQAEIMHTEGACFDGANSPEQASSRFGEAAQYINGGAVNFCYWNMVLNETRTSGWGWRQNSLVVVDRRSGEIDYTPEYNVLFLLSRFIRPGDVRIGSVSVNQPNVISVMNAAGTIKVVIQNDKTAAQTYLLHCDGREVLASLPPRSLCAIEWNPGK
jgi:glucosylceramidase